MRAGIADMGDERTSCDGPAEAFRVKYGCDMGDGLGVDGDGDWMASLPTRTAGEMVRGLVGRAVRYAATGVEGANRRAEPARSVGSISALPNAAGAAWACWLTCGGTAVPRWPVGELLSPVGEEKPERARISATSDSESWGEGASVGSLLVTTAVEGPAPAPGGVKSSSGGPRADDEMVVLPGGVTRRLWGDHDGEPSDPEADSSGTEDIWKSVENDR